MRDRVHWDALAKLNGIIRFEIEAAERFASYACGGSEAVLDR